MSKQATVLIVDDDTWMAAHFAKQLHRASYQSVLAENAIQAIDLIDDKKIDVILLDLFLAGSNGLVLLHELQSHADLAKIPVVLCTNNASSIAIEDVEPYGVKIVLDKMTMQPSDVTDSVWEVTR